MFYSITVWFLLGNGGNGYCSLCQVPQHILEQWMENPDVDGWCIGLVSTVISTLIGVISTLIGVIGTSIGVIST